MNLKLFSVINMICIATSIQAGGVISSPMSKKITPSHKTQPQPVQPAKKQNLAVPIATIAAAGRSPRPAQTSLVLVDYYEPRTETETKIMLAELRKQIALRQEALAKQKQ